MATYTITTGTEGSPTNIDTLTTKAGADTYNINGGFLFVDSHSRYGVNQNTSAVLGNITGSASLGGGIEFNSTKVRLIPYNTGSGNVPALDQAITQGSASGKLLGVYSALNVAPTTAGSAMPASGYILIRQWNSVAYTATTLTGITATATGADRAGWLEIVAADGASAAITINRLNKFKARGDWWDFLGTTTTGTRTTQYQIPTNGALTYCAGVEVETAVGSGIYEFYPNAASRTALVANILTDSTRGKWCWVTTGGLVSFGYDGTNSTGAYCPVSGCKLRVQNLFFQQSTSGAPTVNSIPNATNTTRPEFVTSGGGAIDIDKAQMGWYMNFLQAFSVSLTNVTTFDSLLLQECASAIAWSNVNVGMSAALAYQALTMTLNFAGGTMDKCTWVRTALGSSGYYVTVWQDCTNFTITNQRIYSLTKNGNATSGSMSMTRVTNSTWTTSKFIGSGRVFMIGCDTVKFTTTTYVDNLASTTIIATIPMYAFEFGTAASFRITIDGVDFAGLFWAGPAAGILNIGVAGCDTIKVRNLGTAASPLECGGPLVAGTWSRATTTTTVTKTAHGLKTGDIIAVPACSDVAPKAVTTSSGTVWTLAGAPTADTFTVTVTNSGQTANQTISYYPVLVSCVVNTSASYAAANVYVQRCYTPHLRSGIMVGFDNSNKNVIVEDCWGPEWGAHLVPMLVAQTKGIRANPTLAAQTATYGTHWLDAYSNDNPASVSGVSWARTTTVCTVTSNAHGLRVGEQVLVTVTSDSAAVVLGVKTLTQISAVASPVSMLNTFQFTCLNAGSASGTLTFVPLTAKIALLMNEPTSATTAQVALTGTAAFTSAGGLYMPAVNDQAIFTAPYSIRGHSSFPIAEVVMGGGTLTNHNIYYSVDGGTTWKNLYYQRAGGGGTTNTTLTMTDTTGVAAGDYVRGTNVAPNAKVNSISNGTTVILDTANIGTVSGVLRFNQLPSQTVSDAAVGTPLSIKIVTGTTNTAAITSLYAFSYASNTARTATYPLDTVPVTITVKDASTLAAIQNARIRITTDTGGYIVLEGLTNASGVLTGTTEYAAHAISGTVRRASPGGGTLYKAGAISGTTTSVGFSATVLLTSDE